MSRTAPRLFALAAALLLALPPAAGASVLQSRIDTLIRRSQFSGDRTGLVVFDRANGRLLAVHHGRREMRPASNLKLAISASALGRLGFTTRLRTRVLATGTLSGGTLRGNLYLVGGGDPSLSTVPFSRSAFRGASGLVHDLAAAVRAAGVRRVTGAVYGDESAFDTVRRGPDWKSSSWMDCPPLSALTVNEDWLRFGSFASAPSPALRAAQVLAAGLRRQGVRIAHLPRTGRHPGSARRIALEQSPTMHRLVFEMDQVSDNFFAETLTKDLAVDAGHRGSTGVGVALTHRYLRNLGVDLAGARLADGSGLSKLDRLSPRQIAGILRHAVEQPYGWYYEHALPLAGATGTLEKRMTSGPAYRNARAKTGTLDGASSLSGYVTSRNSRKLVFAMVMNRRHIDVSQARALQDRIVQVLAGSDVS